MEVAAAARISSQSPAALGSLLLRTKARMSPSIDSGTESETDNFCSTFIVFPLRGPSGEGPTLSHQGKQIVADWVEGRLGCFGHPALPRAMNRSYLAALLASKSPTRSGTPSAAMMEVPALGAQAGIGNAGRRHTASAKAGARHCPTCHCALRSRLQSRAWRQCSARVVIVNERAKSADTARLGLAVSLVEPIGAFGQFSSP